MMRRYLFLLLATTLVTSCGEREPASGAVDKPRDAKPEPIVVYASYENEAYLPKLFEGFTRDTGIRVTVRHADRREIVDAVIENRGSPPADLLLTPSVIGAWRAAGEGALRPLASDVIIESVPDLMRDPEGYWTAVSFRPLLIAYDAGQMSSPDIAGFEELANPEFEGKLCLTSSSLDVNRSLIARLIRLHDNRPAEIIVRGWVTNLALPTFASESDLMGAIEAGTCAIGVVSYSAARRRAAGADGTDVREIVPTPTHANVEAAGINRHAREPEAARLLLEWMLSHPVQMDHSMATGAAPASSEIDGDQNTVADWIDENVGAEAWLDEDAAKLAERAGYR